MTKLLLLDLDGTVREPKSGAKFISQPDDQQLIDGVEQAISRYSDWVIAGITNQGGVAAGHKSLQSAIEEQRATIKLLSQMANIYMCPDFEGETCWEIHRTGGLCSTKGSDWGGYRKPNPGMLLLAKACAETELEEPVTEILYVGDRDEDKAAALAAGVPFMWAKHWRNKTQ